MNDGTVNGDGDAGRGVRYIAEDLNNIDRGARFISDTFEGMEKFAQESVVSRKFLNYLEEGMSNGLG